MARRSQIPPPRRLEAMLTDPAAPRLLKLRLLHQLCAVEDDGDSESVLSSVLEAASRGQAETHHLEKAKEYAAKIQQMEEGPLRVGTFLALRQAGSLGRRATVITAEGMTLSCLVKDDDLAGTLRPGDRVFLSGEGAVVLGREPEALEIGEEATLVRRVDEARVCVTLRDDERQVLHATARLRDEIDRHETAAGSRILVSPQGRLAFGRMPGADEAPAYRFLAREPVPDVILARDIGAPPPFLDQLTEHLDREMVDPDLGRRHGIRRAEFRLLTGRSGSGKSLCVLGFWRRMYEVMAAVTGVPLEELPPRVLRLRPARVLSHWYSQSEKNLDAFFDEVQRLSAEPFRTPDGREFLLPVLVILEEADGLARARGDEAVNDRVLTTLLERLEPASRRLGDRLVFFLATSNHPELIDPAFFRRAGGTVERFDRLGRTASRAVLEKVLGERRIRPLRGETQPAAHRRLLARIITWLFGANAHDPGQVDLTFLGETRPVRYYRRDFLTGALFDRSVQQASRIACREERLGCDNPGLTPEMIQVAIHAQVRAIVDQLHPRNAARYLTLPDGVLVQKVERIEQPSLLPIEMERPESGRDEKGGPS